MTFNYQLGTTISFTTFDPNYLGNDYQNVKVVGILDADTAARSGLDIGSEHAMVYPNIPPAVQPLDDPTQYNYIQVVTQNGTRTILGMPWIDETTIVVETNQAATVVIQGVTSTDIANIRKALTMNGYNNLTITLSSTS